MVTIKKIAIAIKAIQLAITFPVLLANITATKIPKNPANVPENPGSIHEAMTKPTAQRRCSPAFAPLKLVPVSLAFVKFAPRISALLKSAPQRFFPLKDCPLRFSPMKSRLPVAYCFRTS
jgi:hypothetical protein